MKRSHSFPSLESFRLATSALALGVALVAGSASLAARAATPGVGVTVTQATLPNGLRIVVLRDTLAPVVSTFLNFHAGSDDEPITGIAHAQEHMAFRDGSILSGAQADEIAGFTGDEDNADTQNEITQYFHLVPSQDLDLALHLDAARFGGLLDAQKDWDVERGAIEQEVTADNSDASYRLYVKILHHVLGGTAYADEGLGTLHSFGHQINAPQLQTFFQTWYHPNNALYVIAGDVEPSAAIASVQQLFGGLQAVAVPAHHAGRLGRLTPASFHDASDRSTTTAIVAYRYPGYDDSEYAASAVLADVLNGRRAALYGLVASGKAISDEADTNYYPKAGFLEVTSEVAIGTAPQRAIANLKAVVEGYRVKGVPVDLVNAAKAHEVAQFQMAADSIEGLAGAWSEALAVEGRTPAQDVAAVERVTPADVDRVVRAWLVNGTATTAYAVPRSGGALSESGAGAGGEKAKAEQTKIAPLPDWAKASLKNLQVPERTIDPTAFVLPNGLHVIVQPERASAAVVVRGEVRHNPGLEEPAGQAGVASVVGDLLPFGTTTYGRLAYQAELDKIAATASAGFTFSLTVPSSNFERGLQLLADDELHPALAAADFTIVKGQEVESLTGDAQNPDHLAAVAQADALYPAADPARRFASAAEVGKLTLAQARSYYAQAFRPDLTTIAIVGDVTPDAARSAVERWFGGWSANGPAPQVDAPAVAPNVAAELTIPATGRVQDTVHLTETLGLTNAGAAIAPLRIADTVLSGDFASTLIRDLRVTTGYVYYVFSRLDAGRTRSTFEVQYGSAPENVGKARALAIRDLERMQTEPVDSEHLLRAKARLLSEIPLAEQSYEGLAQQLVTNAADGLPLDEDVVLARAELAASPQDVESATKQWIRPADFVQTVEGPAPQTK
ncbi:MAG: pitrilysin family protein [Candidatus Baltobacteraceae bacterium]